MKKFLNLGVADAAADPYRRLTKERMWLVHDELEEEKIRIPSTSVICHLVYCPLDMPHGVLAGKKLAVVVSLHW